MCFQLQIFVCLFALLAYANAGFLLNKSYGSSGGYGGSGNYGSGGGGGWNSYSSGTTFEPHIFMSQMWQTS